MWIYIEVKSQELEYKSKSYLTNSANFAIYFQLDFGVDNVVKNIKSNMTNKKITN